MRRLVEAYMAPQDPGSEAARAEEQLLYPRSLWIRMPPLMLASHVLKKALAERGGWQSVAVGATRPVVADVEVARREGVMEARQSAVRSGKT